jgi:hypothetical protein
MLKPGTLVRSRGATIPLMGIIVYDDDTLWQARGVSMMLVTTTGEYQGKVYPFQDHQLEVISESR